MSFLSKLTTLFFISIIANSYSLDGAWNLVPSEGQFKYIDSTATFQFKRQLDNQGAITSQLFVYNCFLSQYYTVLSKTKYLSILKPHLFSPKSAPHLK